MTDAGSHIRTIGGHRWFRASDIQRFVEDAPGLPS
jgi:hypothetical protein